MRYLDPLLGKGCTKTDTSFREMPTVYATQRPSGEKDADGRNIDFASPNATALLSCGPSVHSVCEKPFVTAKMSVPSGDHDSGTCAVSLSAFVSREGVPL